MKNTIFANVQNNESILIEAVHDAYSKTSETFRLNLLTHVRKTKSALFTVWLKRVKRHVGGVTNAKVSKRIGEYGKLLDKTLFEKDYALLLDALRSFFSSDEYIPNTFFLEKTKEHSIDRFDSDPETINSILGEIGRLPDVDNTEFELYKSSLHLIVPEWFIKGETGPEVIVSKKPKREKKVVSRPTIKVREKSDADKSAAKTTGDGTSSHPRVDTSCLIADLRKAKCSFADLSLSLDQLGSLGTKSTENALPILKDITNKLEAATELYPLLPLKKSSHKACHGSEDLQSVCNVIANTEQNIDGLSKIASLMEKHYKILENTQLETNRTLGHIHELQVQLKNNQQIDDAPPGSCLELQLSKDRLSNLHKELNDEHRKKLTKSSNLAISKIVTIRSTYKTSPKYDKTLNDIKSNIDNAKSMREIELETEKINLISNELSEDPSNMQAANLIKTLKDRSDTSLTPIALVTEFLNRGHTHSSALFSYAFQLYRPLDFDCHAVDSHISSMLDATDALFDSNAYPAWANFFTSQPWLTQLNPTKLRIDTQLRIILNLFIATKYNLSAVNLVHKFDKGDLPSSEFPTITGILSSIQHQRKFIVVDQLPQDKINELYSEIESDLSDPFQKLRTGGGRQIKKAGEVLVPKIRNLWQLVKKLNSEASQIKVHDEFDNWRNEARKLIDHPYFGPKTIETLDIFAEKIILYLTLEKQASTTKAFRKRSLVGEIKKVAAGHKWGDTFVELIDHHGGGPVPEPSICSASESVADICIRSSELAQLHPRLVARIAESPDDVLGIDDCCILLQALEHVPAIDEAKQILAQAHCYGLIANMCEADSSESKEWAARETKFTSSLYGRLNALSNLVPEQKQRLEYQLSFGRASWVHSQLLKSEQQSEQLLKSQSSEIDIELRTKRSHVRELMDTVTEQEGDELWSKRTRGVCLRIEELIADALSPQKRLEEKQAASIKLKKILIRLKDHVEFLNTDFSPLEQSIQPTPDAQPQSSEKAKHEIDLSRVLHDAGISTPEEEANSRNLLWKQFREFERVELVDDALRRSAVKFLREIARLGQMYCNEDDSQKRCKSRKVPGLSYYSFLTGFHVPGSRFFEKAVHLGLVGGRKIMRDEISALVRHIESEPGIHIVIACGDTGRVCRQINPPNKPARATILTIDDIRKILESPKSAIPLRHAICRTADLSAISPFKSEGHVLRGRDLYAGRDDILNKLTNGGSFVIWGGRRSGKTSLLHSARIDFELKRKIRYDVAYLSFEALFTREGEDVDALAANQIAKALNLKDTPTTVDSFREALLEKCTTTHVCLLLDELDVYVNQTKNYELIRMLRAVHNTHKERFICVFAGFKALFRAVTMEPDPEDSSYPWKNFVGRCDPIAKIDIKAITSLVHEGFSELLGIEIDVNVPTLIYKYTGGHPAFVQKLCNCVLHSINSRGTSDLRAITESEIDLVYKASGFDSFIGFVSETLGMNLGPLEKIIIFVIAADLIGESDPEQKFSRDTIIYAVNTWFDLLKTPPPSRPSLIESFAFLSMTGMLEPSMEDHVESFKMAFPSYVDILIRLERANQDTISMLVNKYGGQ